MPPDTTEDTMNMSDAGPPTAQGMTRAFNEGLKQIGGETLDKTLLFYVLFVETAMPEAQPFSPEGLATMGTETHHMHDVSLSITKENVYAISLCILISVK